MEGKGRTVRMPCAGLWNTPTVHVSGLLTTCCLDTDLKNSLGNLRDEDLDTLWNGERIHRWRLAQIRGRFDESGPACTSCNFESAGSYPVEKVMKYLEKRGESVVLKELLKGMEKAKEVSDEEKG